MRVKLATFLLRAEELHTTAWSVAVFDVSSAPCRGARNMVSRYLAIGLALGVAIGTATHNLGLGIALGLVLGLMVGRLQARVPGDEE
jgi:hypothetical protein